MPKPIRLNKPGQTMFERMTASAKAKAEFRKLLKAKARPRTQGNSKATARQQQGNAKHSSCRLRLNGGMNTKTLLPLKAVARALRVKPESLKGEADAGRVPFTKVGTEYMFVLEAVEAALADRAAKGEGHAK